MTWFYRSAQKWSLHKGIIIFSDCAMALQCFGHAASSIIVACTKLVLVLDLPGVKPSELSTVTCRAPKGGPAFRASLGSARASDSMTETRGILFGTPHAHALGHCLYHGHPED